MPSTYKGTVDTVQGKVNIAGYLIVLVCVYIFQVYYASIVLMYIYIFQVYSISTVLCCISKDVYVDDFSEYWKKKKTPFHVSRIIFALDCITISLSTGKKLMRYYQPAGTRWAFKGSYDSMDIQLVCVIITCFWHAGLYNKFCKTQRMENIWGHWSDTCAWSTENKQIQMLYIPYNTRWKTRRVANKHCTDDQSYSWQWEPGTATFITKTRPTVRKHKIMPKRFLWNDSGYHACRNVSDLLFTCCLANMTNDSAFTIWRGEKEKKRKKLIQKAQSVTHFITLSICGTIASNIPHKLETDKSLYDTHK